MSHCWRWEMTHLNFGSRRTRWIVIDAFVWKNFWFFIDFVCNLLNSFISKMINFLPQCCICCLHQGFTDIQSDWKVGRSRWCPWSPDLIEHIIGPVKSFQINFRILTQNLFFICLLRLYINRMIDQIIRRNSFHEFLNWWSLDSGSANQRAAYDSLANRKNKISIWKPA